MVTERQQWEVRKEGEAVRIDNNNLVLVEGETHRVFEGKSHDMHSVISSIFQFI